MRHVWSVLCRIYLEDQGSQNPSLIEVVDRVSFKIDLPEQRPVNIPIPLSINLVSMWWKDCDENGLAIPVKLRFLSPAQKELFDAEQNVDLPTAPKFRTNFVVGSLLFDANGIYEFEVAYKNNEDWEVVASIPLEIFHEQPDDQPESKPIE